MSIRIKMILLFGTVINANVFAYNMYWITNFQNNSDHDILVSAEEDLSWDGWYPKDYYKPNNDKYMGTIIKAHETADIGADCNISSIKRQNAKSLLYRIYWIDYTDFATMPYKHLVSKMALEYRE